MYSLTTLALSLCKLSVAFTSPLQNSRYAFAPSLVPLGAAVQQQQQEQQVEALNTALAGVQDSAIKTCKVAYGPEGSLVASKKISRGDVMLSMPYDDLWTFTPDLALTKVFKGVLPDAYDAWTGDAGLVALLLLNEVARSSGNGIDLPKRTGAVEKLMQAWIQNLPSPDELRSHPLLWSETDQEVLQSSSTTKIYRVLDDIEEDVAWLKERIWSDNGDKFPETATLADGTSVPCFSLEGYKWAMAIVTSRSIYLDGQLRLLPVFDSCQHADSKALEVEGGTMGTFGTTKGAVLRADQAYNKGDAVYLSHGPKSSADYVLEHGFMPTNIRKMDVSELTFQVDPDDRFYDDKMDILEFETYDLAPMDPSQSFTVISQPGRDGEPDPAMIQFARLCKLNGQDAFLLESIFRREVWEFMALPVSEANELAVVDFIVEACNKALEEFKAHPVPDGGPEMCQLLQQSETKALTKTLEYLLREKEALDLKVYYQERRLKDLGLDSEWSQEEDEAIERLPGNANYDW